MGKLLGLLVGVGTMEEVQRQCPRLQHCRIRQPLDEPFCSRMVRERGTDGLGPETTSNNGRVVNNTFKVRRIGRIGRKSMTRPGMVRVIGA